MRTVSAERLEGYVRTLAGFGTRHSLSSADDPRRGIGAARRWIRATLEKCALDSGGRLKVEMDEFVQAPTPRTPNATPMTNVVATLEGDDPQARGRTLVVSGHYDSMCGNVMNAECDAPGANDDASGTAVVIELACTMSKRRFPATLTFLAVAGEEQGLLGSAHWAQGARARGVNVEAMITNDIVGNAHDDTGRRDASTVRLFAEGVPAGKELSEELQRRLATGGENDSPARELARSMIDAAKRYVPEMTVKLVYRRDRYLRGGDHIPFLAQGYAAVRFTEAHEDFRHQHQDVRVVDGVQFGDLPQFVDFAYLAGGRARERGGARLARARTRSAVRRADRDAAAREPDDAVVARQSRSPASPATKSSGGTRRRRPGKARSSSATSRARACRLPKDDYVFSVRAVGRRRAPQPRDLPAAAARTRARGRTRAASAQGLTPATNYFAAAERPGCRASATSSPAGISASPRRPTPTGR